MPREMTYPGSPIHTERICTAFKGCHEPVFDGYKGKRYCMRGHLQKKCQL